MELLFGLALNIIIMYTIWEVYKTIKKKESKRLVPNIIFGFVMFVHVCNIILLLAGKRDLDPHLSILDGLLIIFLVVISVLAVLGKGFTFKGYTKKENIFSFVFMVTMMLESILY